ncbi:hypothetical protein PR048_025249 [Dryococelus australis]|uniref:Uncharacterized protein n=1 Tax=Dryococelus australis TaxID=614101 RepID=A0ABQ9GQU6_9NEOP|nr:hypothetical protein PR048_025249 [Dryococelus australis]
MKSKKTVFNHFWLDATVNPEFASWLCKVEGNANQAFCSVCKRTFQLSNMGQQAVVSHSKGPKHLEFIGHSTLNDTEEQRMQVLQDEKLCKQNLATPDLDSFVCKSDISRA